MELFVPILVATFVPIFLAVVLSGKQWRAEEDRARERRLHDARMDARLLRFNI